MDSVSVVVSSVGEAVDVVSSSAATVVLAKSALTVVLSISPVVIVSIIFAAAPSEIPTVNCVFANSSATDFLMASKASYNAAATSAEVALLQESILCIL